MKISTRFNLFVGCFFFFVFLAVFYSYCGGLHVCYSFPFFNGIRSGSVSKAVMTSYNIDKKGESRYHAGNTIYFYSKVKSQPHLTNLKEVTKKPGDENNTRKATGPSINKPPSDITGKTALEILRKSNVSLEEANRELFREEKVDKEVDREDFIKAKAISTQSTPITKNRGGLGLKNIHQRSHPIRKPPRRLRKNSRKNRINKFSKQDRIDRALEKELEKAELVMRMRGYGPGNESFTSNISHLRKTAGISVTPKKHVKQVNANQTKGKVNSINEAVSPLDIIKYRNEAITYKPSNAESKWENTSLTLKSSQHLKNNIKNSTIRFENERSPLKNIRNKKGLLPKKEKYKERQVISEQKYSFVSVKNPENKTLANETGISSHGNNMTSSGRVKKKRRKEEKVDEGSGARRYKSVSKGELLRSIRNINDQHIKLVLQSALNKDEPRLKKDVLKVKTSLEQNYRPFNLTKVLRELVTAVELDKSSEIFPGTHLKEEILLKRRNSDWDKPLVRVKRLGRIRRRNDKSEKTLIRVKRIEDEEPEKLNNAFRVGQLGDAPKKQNLH